MESSADNVKFRVCSIFPIYFHDTGDNVKRIVLCPITYLRPTPSFLIPRLPHKKIWGSCQYVKNSSLYHIKNNKSKNCTRSKNYTY